MQAKFLYTRPESMEYKKYSMDFLNANTIQGNQNGLYWWILIAITILITAIVWVFTSWILALTLIAVILTLYGPLLLFQVRKQSKEHADEKIMSFSELGREQSCKETRFSRHWQNYDRVGERELLFFLHFGDEIEAIPKRVFDETELATFRNWISVIDDSPATGQAKLYSELLSQGPPDLQFDFEHQDLLDITSEIVEPVVTPENEIQMGKHPLGDYAFPAVLLVFFLGSFAHWFFLKLAGFEPFVCGVGIIFWLYALSFLSKKFQLQPSEEETAKQFPFKDMTVFIKPEGFGVGLPGSVDFYGWRDVTGVWENSHGLQVGVLKNRAHVIPKRLFKNEIESKEFLRRLVAIREKGRSQPKVGTVNTSNPYQSPAATSQRSGDQLAFDSPSSAFYSLIIGMLFLFALMVFMFSVGGFLIWEFANLVAQAEPRPSILILAGRLAGAAMMTFLGGFLLYFSMKGVTLWRHRNDKYRINRTTFWLNDQAFPLSELRIRTKKTLQLGYIVNGDNVLTAFDTECPVRKKILSLIPNEETDG